MAMPIGKAEENELSNLLSQVSGNEEAEAHVSRVLSAVSGPGGMHNAAAIVGDHVADSVQQAEALKNEGNRYFVAGNFDNALLSYKKAIDAFKDYGPTVLGSSAKKMLVAVCSESAQAYLKLGAETDASIDCASAASGAWQMADLALALEPTNVKARFCRGSAFALCQDWSQARSDFDWTLHMEPGNDAAKRKLRSVLKQLCSEKDNASSGQTSWEKAAVAAVKDGQFEDPRRKKSNEPAVAMPIDKQVERQVAMAAQLERGAAQYFEAKGHLQVWNMELDELQKHADELAETTANKVLELQEEGKDLEDALGPRAAPLAAMGKERRRRYIEADAFITTVKETFPSDFNEIVKLAPTL